MQGVVFQEPEGARSSGREGRSDGFSAARNGAALHSEVSRLCRAGSWASREYQPTWDKFCSESEILPLITFLRANIACGFFWSGFDLRNFVPGANTSPVFRSFR